MAALLLLIAGVTVYLLVARRLRFRRLQEMRAQVKHMKETHTYADITPLMAQSIAHCPILYDMPFISRLGAQVALFKTYGIATISQILLDTGELANPLSASKRITDTAIILSSFIICPLAGDTDTDPRGVIALARMNWLHRRYRISNADMLYTLSLFILQPMRLTDMFDWRSYTTEERECVFLMWKEIGRRMGIQDIPTSLEEFEAWSEEYESEHMVPSETSHALATLAIEHISNRVPNIPGLRSLVTSLFICLLDDRLRNAMMLPKQSQWAHITVHSIFGIRAFIVKHLMLPRHNPSRYIVLDNPPSGVGPDGLERLYTVIRQTYPWYFPIPQGWRFRVDRLRMRLGLGVNPALYPGPKFKSEGYRIEELGPTRFEQDGHAAVFAEAESILRCPINGKWSRNLQR